MLIVPGRHCVQWMERSSSLIEGGKVRVWEHLKTGQVSNLMVDIPEYPDIPEHADIPEH